MLRLFAGAGIEPIGAEVTAGEDGEYRIDFLLSPDLIVEVDGYVWHFSPEHKQRDDHRRNELRLAGQVVLVYSWVDVTSDPRKVIAQITTARERLQAATGKAC
jgi:very-short-patch-repair endonuclease